LEFAVAKFPDHPQLPFDGGLPEEPKKNGKTPHRRSAAPPPAPVPHQRGWLQQFGRRVFRWAVRVARDTVHEFVVKLVLASVLGVLGFGVADEGFDLFGRHSRRASEKAAARAIEPWTVEVRNSGSDVKK
jgi:hypothetical protein